MNAKRRKRVKEVIDTVEKLLASLNGIKIDHIVDELKDLCDEETEAYDNMPEPLQWSDRGMQIDQNMTNLDDAHDLMEEVPDLIKEIKEKLEGVLSDLNEVE